MGEEINLVLDQSDTEMVFEPVVEETEEKVEKKSKGRKKATETVVEEETLVNCLRNELINVKIVPKHIDWITTKAHPLSNGKADGTVNIYTVPKLRNGEFKNPLTKAEKEFLEDYMGLEPNALSIHKKAEENFWVNRQVIVQKEGTVLDLSTPMGYINYKILLMNSDFICPSLEDLRLMPKATYQFVLVSNKEDFNITADRVSTKSKCWKEYGKIENDESTLKALLESLEGRPIGDDVQLEYLQDRVVTQLEDNPKDFLSVITDPLLSYKVTLRTAVEENVVENRGGYYYYNNTPLCGRNENPTVTVAAKYISNPRNQELLFSIQGKIRK